MRRDHGFTLLEVLVATAILAVSLALVFPTMSGGRRLSQRAEADLRALLVAQSVLAGFEADIAVMPRTGEVSGLRWRASVVPAGGPAPPGWAGWQVSVAVEPAMGTAPVVLATAVAGPAMSAPRNST